MGLEQEALYLRRTLAEISKLKMASTCTFQKSCSPTNTTYFVSAVRNVTIAQASLILDSLIIWLSEAALDS